MFFIGLAILLIVLFFLYELLRRNKWLAFGAFLALPFILLPLWLQEEHTIFAWIKIYSVVLGAGWIAAVRYTSLQYKDWVKAVFYPFLALNIAEAVIQDIINGHPLNYINAVTGIILIATLPGARSVTIDEEKGYKDLFWNIPILWIISYTIWNLMFIHMTFPIHTGLHASVLGAALIVGLINNKLWIQARAYTLGIFALLLFTYAPILEPIYTPRVIIEPMAWIGVTIGLVLAIVHCGRLFLDKKRASISQQYIS